MARFRWFAAQVSVAILLLLTIGAKSQIAPADFPKVRFFTNGKVTAFALQPDGRIIVAGEFSMINGEPRQNLARLDPNGAVDPFWAPALPNGSQVFALAVDGDNLYVGGSFSSIGGQPRRNLAKLSLTEGGIPDPGWLPQPNDFVYSLLIEGSHLYVGGNFITITGQSVPRLARVDKVGTAAVDVTWRPNPNNSVRTLLHSGDALIVGGFFNPGDGGLSASIGGGLAKLVARIPFTGDGSLDAAWNPNFFETGGGSVTSLTSANGAVYAGGHFGATEEITNLVRLNETSGTIDSAWSPRPRKRKADGSLTRGTITSLVASPDGLWACGDFDEIGQLGQPGLAKLDLTGTGSSSDTWRPEFDGAVSTLLLSPSGLLVGGEFAAYRENDSTLGMARLGLIVGNRDPLFQAQAQNAADTIQVRGRQPDGKLIVIGNFRAAGNLLRRYLARLNVDGSLDTTWAPNPNGGVSALLLNGTTMYVAGSFSRIGGETRFSLAKINLSGSDSADPDWKADVSGGVSVLALEGTKLYVGGDFSAINSVGRSSLARVDAETGAVDPLWNPEVRLAARNLRGNITALAVQGDVIYAGGNFDLIGQSTRFYLAKLSAQGTGSADPTWAPNPTLATYTFFLPFPPFNAVAVPGRPISNIIPVGGSVIVSGAFDSIGSSGRKFLAKLNSAGEGQAEQSWNPEPVGHPKVERVATLAVAGDQLYVGGNFASIGGLDVPHLARINLETGAADPEFIPSPAMGDRYVGYFELVPGGSGISGLFTEGSRTYITGGFTAIGGEPRPGFALLTAGKAPTIVQNPDGRVFIARHQEDGDEITHFQVTQILGGTLFLNDGQTPVFEGDFITIADGQTGLAFIPEAGNTGAGTISAVAAVSPTQQGSGNLVSTSKVASSRAVVRFEAATYTVGEGSGNVVLTVVKTGTGPASIKYRTQNGTATAFNFSTGHGDFFSIPSEEQLLNFSENETTKTVRIPIFDDGPSTPTEGDETFTVVLAEPSTETVLGSTITAIVTIRDNDIVGSSGSFTDIQAPSPLLPEPSLGILRVNIDPAVAVGQWRLLGEPLWRDRGTSISGLVDGNYTIEFKPVNGYEPPSPLIIPVTSGETYTASVQYASASSTITTGGLTVEIAPANVANATDATLRGEWRRIGETDWHRSGEIQPALNTGIYIVEFKTIPGRTTPPAQSVRVLADQVAQTNGSYLFQTTGSGASPVPLAFEDATTTEPYLFNGQLLTDVGFGSGSVVKSRTVLTAAHVLFDDSSLTFTTGVKWFHRRHRERYEPVAKVARGWYVFDGYSSQRALDNSPGVSSEGSQNLDVGAVYFLEPAAKGGFGGYLASDSNSNEWLTSSREKRLVGYPVDTVFNNDRGKMHVSTAPTVAFQYLYGRVYSTGDIKSYAGGSGGALYIKSDTGKFYPAGVYLGGNQTTLIRAIDNQVVDLINRAETSGNGGGNNVGGGAVVVSPGVTAGAFAIGNVSCRLGPSAALGSGAAWRFRGEKTFRSSDSSVGLSPGTAVIEFKSVPGFATPPNRTVSVAPNQNSNITVGYSPLGPPMITSSLIASAVQSRSFSYLISATNNPASFKAQGLPAGLKLNSNTGVISGSPTVAGEFSVTISASHIGGTDSKILTLSILPPAPPVVTSEGTQGVEGSQFHYQIKATNLPSSFDAIGLPDGLSINSSTGMIAGIPLTSGTYSIQVTASNVGGSGSGVLTLIILPRVTSPLLASVAQGQFFQYRLEASLPATGYKIGTLPIGLNFDATLGQISGTLTASGVFLIPLEVQTQKGTATATLRLEVAPVPGGQLLAQGVLGQLLLYQINADEPVSSYGAQNLPAGLTVDPSTGLISGIPTQAGKFNVTVQTTNAGGTGSQVVQFNIQIILKLIVTPGGTVSGAALPQSLQNAGDPISLAAVPETGFVFAGWSGDEETSDLTLVFSTVEHTTLTAHFSKRNSLKGTYFGVLKGTPSAFENSGFMSVTMSGSGRYSAKIRVGDITYSARGEIPASGKSVSQVQKKGAAPITLNLRSNPTSQLNVSIEGSEVPFTTSVLSKPGYDAKRNPFPEELRGRFSIVFPLGAASSRDETPRGYAFGLATVNKAGVLKFKGILSDGLPVIQVVPLTSTLDWPVFFSPERGTFTIGEATILPSSRSIQGMVDEFDSSPTAGSPAIASFDVEGLPTVPISENIDQVTINAGDTPPIMTKVLVIPRNGKVVADRSNGFSMSVSPETGSFKGRFTPSDGIQRKFRGILLPDGSRRGFGIFTGRAVPVGGISIHPDEPLP